MGKSNSILNNPKKLYYLGFGGGLLLAIILIFAINAFNNSNDKDDISGIPETEEDIPILEEEEESSQEIISEEENDSFISNSQSASNSEFTGTWRAYSERLFYDEGGGGSTLSASSGTASTQKLKITSSKWEYGSSSGSWSVSPTTDADWTSWGIENYGPTRKMVLNGWKGSTASGPIEESSGNINFIWILYRAGPPTTSRPGTVHMKFGK